jgi:hypothetical protein
LAQLALSVQSGWEHWSIGNVFSCALLNSVDCPPGACQDVLWGMASTATAGWL